MRKQVIVIGLGQFGMALSRTLSERGVEVLAVDVNEERVRLASAFVVEAACFDATDEQALMRAAPERRARSRVDIASNPAAARARAGVARALSQSARGHATRLATPRARIAVVGHLQSRPD